MVRAGGCRFGGLMSQKSSFPMHVRYTTHSPEAGRPRMSKKPYTKPMVTDLGNAVQETRGITGKCWEQYGTAYGPPLGPGDFTDEQTEEKQD